MPIKAVHSALPLNASAALLLIISTLIERAPLLVWNVSASVPVGLYMLRPEASHVGDTAAVRLPLHVRQVADDRRYLPASFLLLKPVAAMPGDRVCRWQTRIFINGQLRAEAAHRDAARRPMPVWQGCRRLRAGEIFVLSPSNGSFDSRYFGPIGQDAVVGIARPIVTL